MSIVRELKAKKAKYGFATQLGSYNVVALGMFIATACRGAQMGRDFTIECNQSGSSHELKIYTDDDALAAQIRDVNAFEIPRETQAFLDGGNLFEKAVQERFAVGDAPGV